ncbi:cAMP-binding domain of CRP or a regulatory subunit of cAMP-dependent protein kinases [Flexibacter flexilis DSM 6793]|uniref:cAMP-binding domain of CRP or a regulatory subunit of cAMP-dependent protein kinases n=1 Tax=Flexibacter flexilis DSM 6793 TaxID=927664 RepID=A0A1I1GXI6_9BACT|nr:Crp/Fnr family transcriptional regulator [Flexibacter flexilis]SFC16225.1 cAMP-binding domain of CRP or a regulatory subunit of cAMP-dependent protein kinases [Flexibacter flexilis DSM 6793]
MSELFRQHIEKIVPLTDQEFALVSSFFVKKKLKKHQFLVQAGELAPYDFWVEKGLLRAYLLEENGKEQILQFAMEDWWITDYQAHFSAQPATLNVDCLEDCQVLCISQEDKDRLCAQLQKFEHFFRKKSNAGYVALQKRILSLLTDQAHERYQQFLSLYPSIIQRVPKKYIASYLGVSRETLSRLSG